MTRNFNEQQLIRREKLEKIKNLGIDVFYEKFSSNSNSLELTSKYDNLSKEELILVTNKFKISGRIMMFRDQGKAAFLSIKDFYGNFQVYFKTIELPEIDQKLIPLLDLGDVIGIEGNLMKTNTGQLTLRATSLKLLSKCLTPLPDKFKGLDDIEEIYRRRYLDLIMNDDSKLVFIKRTQIINEIRNYLNSKGYLDVEIPILSLFNTGASAKPFFTHHNALDLDLTLRIATELPLKKLVVGGLDKVYELGRIFRNEGISNKHNPEFTSVEMYQAHADVDDMIEHAENIISSVCQKINGTTEIVYQNQKISLKAPFKRVEMIDLIKEVTSIDFSKLTDFEKAKKIVADQGITLQKHWTTIGYLINAMFEEKCEEKLIQPTIVTGYPIEVSPLAKLRKGSTNITDRFELFIGAREYGNGYSELNNPDEQYQRFLDQAEQKKLGNDEASDIDLDFIESLEYGLVSTGGLGIGIDRLVMLLTNSSSIRDVILFPLQKPKN